MVAWPFQPGGAQAAYFGPIVDGSLTRYYCFALGLFSTGISWIFVSIHEFGGTRTSSGADCHALCPSLVADVLPQARLLHHLRTQLESSRLLVCCDLGTGRGAASDGADRVPVASRGYSPCQYDLAGWAPLGSVFLVSGVIALFAELLILGWSAPSWAQYRAAYGINGFTDGDGMGVRIEWTEPRGVLAVAAVQGNLDQRTKWQSHQFDANFDRHWQPTLGCPRLTWWWARGFLHRL